MDDYIKTVTELSTQVDDQRKYKVDREKLSYDLAVRFAQADLENQIRSGKHVDENLAIEMIHSFRTAYRKYLTLPYSLFDMQECINSEASID